MCFSIFPAHFESKRYYLKKEIVVLFCVLLPVMNVRLCFLENMSFFLNKNNSFTLNFNIINT